MWVGEWAISTNFNATDDFLRKWADAQKLAYSQGAGWLVCFFCLCDKVGHKHNIAVLELQARGVESPRASMVKVLIVLENWAQQCYFIGHIWKVLGSGTLLRIRRNTTTRTCASHTETFQVLPAIPPRASAVTCLQIPFGVPIYITSEPSGTYYIDNVKFCRTESRINPTLVWIALSASDTSYIMWIFHSLAITHSKCLRSLPFTTFIQEYNVDVWESFKVQHELGPVSTIATVEWRPWREKSRTQQVLNSVHRALYGSHSTAEP